MNVTDVYKHKHFENLVLVSAIANGWVEFFNKKSKELFWLEQSIFEQAYTRYEDSEAYVFMQDDIDNLNVLRQLAQIKGILIPREIQEVVGMDTRSV